MAPWHSLQEPHFQHLDLNKIFVDMMAVKVSLKKLGGFFMKTRVSLSHT